jgi:hypothetical protein
MDDQNCWWKTEIPRLRTIIEDLNMRLSGAGTWGNGRKQLLSEKTAWQFELDNALKAAAIHEKADRDVRTKANATTS